MRVGIKPGQWGWTFDELIGSWRAADEAGFDIISCFDHVSAAPAGLAAWDAAALLTAMAGATQRAALAVDVLNVSLREPFLLAGQLAVAQAFSGGRLQVGLGAGSHHLARFDHAALGRPFPTLAQRRERLAHCCQAFPALWRGEQVSDAELGLHAATLGPLGIKPPPVYVGGSGLGTIAVAVRHADGWNAVIRDAEHFAELTARVDRLCVELGRDRPLLRAAQVFLRDVALSDARRLVGELAELGAESTTFVLVEERGPRAVHKLARAAL
jgi:alkanesulfonate monooxygenase SsuD/methylene tetrahydromethanopterin reductase-like flavin-dependent oxidoreductase (luciferase family)